MVSEHRNGLKSTNVNTYRLLTSEITRVKFRPIESIIDFQRQLRQYETIW